MFKFDKWKENFGLEARHMRTEESLFIPATLLPVTAKANIVLFATLTKAIIMFSRSLWWRRKEEVELRSLRSVHLWTRFVTRKVKSVAIEYFAACGESQTTNAPGPQSFTSALIWALQRLRTEERFQTTKLLQKIKDAPDFPRAQYPLLSSANSGNDRITIAANSSDRGQNKTFVLALIWEHNDLPGLIEEVSYLTHLTLHWAS